MAMSVMLAHLTRQKYKVWSKILLLHIITLSSLLIASALDLPVDSYNIFIAMFVVSCICQFHFVIGMVFEISKSLGIKVF